MNNSNISDQSSYLPATKENDFGTVLRSTNSTPNTTSKINEYFANYDRNNSGTDLHMLNQSSSDFDFTSKYFSTRAAEFEPSGYQFGQNNVFRTKDYINGKTNKGKFRIVMQRNKIVLKLLDYTFSEKIETYLLQFLRVAKTL